MFDTHVDLMPLVIVLIQSLAVPFFLFLVRLEMAKATKLLAPYLGAKQAASLADQLDGLLDKAIGAAAMHYLPELQAKGLTVDTGNLLAAKAAEYAVNHAPELSQKVHAFEGSLEDKVKARLITHPAVAVSTAQPHSFLPHA